ncbi:MAG: hypothetical protein HDS09_05490 [Bacteroides sp.]|nr:hypothetical protein [Bacteroides sp.]
MSNKNHSCRVSSAKLRTLLDQLVDKIRTSQDRVILALSGNTFNIHFNDATINISMKPAKEGGDK